MKISLVPREETTTVWHTVAPMIEKAIPYCKGRFSIVDIFHDVLTGEQTLWVAFDEGEIYGAVTVRIVQYPDCKALRLETLGGHSVRKWLREGFRTMESYARTCGCQKIEAFGRPEWGRFFKRLGLKPFAIQYEHNLDEHNLETQP
jgi:hypothetical protein